MTTDFPIMTNVFYLRTHPTIYAISVEQLHKNQAGGVKMVKMATLSGVRLQAVIECVLSAVKTSGHKPTELRLKYAMDMNLTEAAGVRLILVMLAVSDISRPARIESIAKAIQSMPVEEVYYWYSKCTSPYYRGRGIKALRALLSED